MDLQNFWISSGAAGGGGGGDQGTAIRNSLRFRGNEFLINTTVGVPNNDFTCSVWIKSEVSGRAGGLIGSNTNVNDGYSLRSQNDICSRTGAGWGTVLTDGLLRDPAAWYHLVFQNDGGTTTLFINGVQQTNTSNTFARTSGRTVIGAANSNVPDEPFRGYMADVHMIDGLVLIPECFGRENAQGIWVPIAGSRQDLATPRDFNSEDYGANGFHLDFHDPDNIGEDVAPTGTGHATANNFTPNGFELTTATDPDFDQMTDSPTQNFATLNPLYPNRDSDHMEDGNLSCEQQGFTENSTIVFNTSTSGNWIAEFQRTATGNSSAFGVVETSTGFVTHWTDVYTGMRSSGKVKLGGVDQGETGVNWGTLGDVVDCRFTAADRSLRFRVNGSEVGAPLPITLPANTDFYVTGGITTTSPSGTVGAFNYGQQEFSNAPPAGFNALQTQTMPTPTILNGSDHFRALTGTGANILAIAQGTNNNGTNWNPNVNTGFANGLWWIKDMDNTNQHQLVDSVRGVNQAVNTPNCQNGNYVAPAGNSVAWCWTAPTEFTNAAGTNGASIASTGRVNTDAGFSIVTYTGTGVAGTVAHGLTDTPEFYMVKRTDASTEWRVFSSSLDDPAEEVLVLNNNDGATVIDTWNNTLPTNTVFSLSATPAVNRDTSTYVAYCWHSVPGYSAFGSYRGNVNNDGPFCYTGMKPAFILIKGTSAGNSWLILDSTRETNNPIGQTLRPDSTTAEGNFLRNVDFLSNGFKIRTSNDHINNKGQTYIYAAFAENPFGGENTAPANAR